MSGDQYAAALVHIPDDPDNGGDGSTYYTPFRGDHAGQRAHQFADSERERGDFPGSLWTVVMNEAAREQLTEDRMAMLGFATSQDTTDIGGGDA